MGEENESDLSQGIVIVRHEMIHWLLNVTGYTRVANCYVWALNSHCSGNKTKDPRM